MLILASYWHGIVSNSCGLKHTSETFPMIKIQREEKFLFDPKGAIKLESVTFILNERIIVAFKAHDNPSKKKERKKIVESLLLHCVFFFYTLLFFCVCTS